MLLAQVCVSVKSATQFSLTAINLLL